MKGERHRLSQSVPITTKIESSNLNLVHGKYLDDNIMWKFVSDLQQVGGFRQALQFPPSIKLTAMI